MNDAKIIIHFNNASIEISASSPKDAIKKLSAYTTLFQEPVCKLCNSEHTVLQHRSRDGNDYYYVKCLHCFAELSFGQHKSGDTLFIKNKTDQGFLPNGGWHKYQKPQQGQEQDRERFVF